MELIARFKTVDDDEQIVWVFEYQEYVDAGHHGNPNARIPGMRSLLDDDGHNVNSAGEGHFRLMDGTKVRIIERIEE